MSTFVLCVGCGEPLYGFSPCQWCTCEWCVNDLLDGFCSLCNSRNSCIYDPNSNSFDCPPDSCHPPHPIYETYSYDSCGNDYHFGYDCQPQFPLNYESEPGYIKNYNSYPYDSSSFPQQYLCCENREGPHETFQCQPMNQNFYNSNSSGFDQSQPPQFPVIHQPPQEMSIQEMEDLKQQYLDEMKRLINSEYRDEIKIDELKGNYNSMSIEINKKEKLQQLEQVANLSVYPSKHFNYFCCDNDDDEDYTIAVTPSLSTEEPDNSLSMGDEHLDNIPVTESDEFIKSSVENLIPILSESEGIPENTCDVPFHDNSLPLDVSKDQFEDFFDSDEEFSSTDDDSFSIDNIEYVEESPPDSEIVSSEVMEIVILEVGGIDDDILLTIKDEISGGSTTTRSDISLPEYKAFYDDHVKEISSGSTTTHSDSSLYDSFIFDLSINPFPPADRRDFTMDVMEDISPTREPRVHNALPTHPTLQLNLKFILSSESLFTYVVWIFLLFLLYLVAPQYLLSLDVSHRSGTFTKFKVLNESPMEILISTCSPMDQ
uniref:Pre-mRNA splicing Prp18-interacting factor n=1 Tax=Tanacetum cinerariifolium TaxID=118510 RepID=A0A6L2NJ90_TANCI|nr:hypothetical protein [Tanacetum cinerariifolium]